MSFVNPRGRRMCPHCFEQIHLGDCEVVSTRSGNVLDPAPKGFIRMMRRVMLPRLKGAKYVTEMAARRCYRCGKVLPNNVEYMPNVVIGVVGTSQSGKSHFIASLIHALERGEVCRGIGCLELHPKSDSQQVYDEGYYRPLFVDKTAIVATQKASQAKPYTPLIYEMVFETRNLDGSRKKMNLVLFDANGEDLLDTSRRTQFARYVSNAAGLIFLIDPMTVEDIVNGLPPHLKPRQAPSAPSFRMLRDIADMCRTEKGVSPDDRLNIPIVLALSKSDLVLHALGVRIEPRFRYEPTYRDGFHRDDYQAVSDEVREIVRRMDGAAIDMASGAFADVSYSAVTATGGSPDAIGKFKEVRPSRCADPLLWQLWKLGYIQAI